MILHPDLRIRQFAVQYFKDSQYKDPDLMPLVLEACNLAIDEKQNRLMLAYAAEFTQTRETLEEIVKRILDRGPARDCYEKMLVNSEIQLLKQFPNRIADLLPPFQKAVRLRLELADWCTDKLWQELFELSKRAEGKYCNEFDYNYGVYVVKELAVRSDLPVEEIVERLDQFYPEDYEGYADIYLCILAGDLRLQKAIPALTNYLRSEGDLIVEEAVKAMIKIGTEEVVTGIRKTFLKEEWDFRLFSTDILSGIKLPVCEAAVIELMSQEEDLSIRTRLADSLCQLLSVKGIPFVEEMIDGGYDRSLLSSEESLYVNCTINGVDLPELETWRAQLDAEEEERRKTVESFNHLFLNNRMISAENFSTNRQRAENRKK
ncbi:HEAT repeat domain-containing protein [Effusibacillus consociatus]|uniref:HEAT repeat domain-containing protein n=1 Tax=Effusibacillus consociatus TaxID=1117041 RepID=A0ABV9Q298_9BACL